MQLSYKTSYKKCKYLETAEIKKDYQKIRYQLNPKIE